MAEQQEHLQAKHIEYLAKESYKCKTHYVGEYHVQDRTMFKVVQIEILKMAAGFLQFVLHFIEVDMVDDDTGEVYSKAQDPPRTATLQQAWSGKYQVSGLS